MRGQPTSKNLSGTTYEALDKWYKNLLKEFKKGLTPNTVETDKKGYNQTVKAKPNQEQQEAQDRFNSWMKSLEGTSLTPEIEFRVLELRNDQSGELYYTHILILPKGAGVPENSYVTDGVVGYVRVRPWDRVWGSSIEMKRSNGWIRHNQKKKKGKDKDGATVPAMQYKVIFYKLIKYEAEVDAYDDASVKTAIKSEDFSKPPVEVGTWPAETKRWEWKSKQESAWKYMTEGDI